MRVSCAIVVLLIASALAKQTISPKIQFEDFIKTHKRHYSTQVEYGKRFQIFQDNLARAEKLNIENRGSAVFGVTKFSDLTVEEFTSQYLTKSSQIGKLGGNIKTQFNNNANSLNCQPSSENFDWSSCGAVSTVKDQGKCNCGWAMAAVENLESSYAINTGSLTALSVEQVLDCNSKVGCVGGNLTNAIQYIQSSNGLVADSEYPFIAGGGVGDSCKINSVVTTTTSTSAASTGGLTTSKHQWTTGRVTSTSTSTTTNKPTTTSTTWHTSTTSTTWHTSTSTSHGTSSSSHSTSSGSSSASGGSSNSGGKTSSGKSTSTGSSTGSTGTSTGSTGTSTASTGPTGSTSQVTGSTSQVTGSTSQVTGSTSQVTGSTSQVTGSTSTGQPTGSSTGSPTGDTSSTTGDSSSTTGDSSSTSGGATGAYESDYEVFERSTISATPITTIANYSLLAGETGIYAQLSSKSGSPVIVAVDASNWALYKSGVITSCGSTPNHYVLTVGYMSYGQEGAHWVVRNSWGSSWGEEGNIYLAIGTDVCGISQYPVVLEAKY